MIKNKQQKRDHVHSGTNGFCQEDEQETSETYFPVKKVFQYQFDFDVGHLIKSPCRECRDDINLPECAEKCVIVDRIQTLLAETISCTRRS